MFSLGHSCFSLLQFATSPYSIRSASFFYMVSLWPPAFDYVTCGEHKEEVFWNQRWSKLESMLLLNSIKWTSLHESVSSVVYGLLRPALWRLNEIVPRTVLGTGRDLGNMNTKQLIPTEIPCLTGPTWRLKKEKISEMKQLGEELH